MQQTPRHTNQFTGRDSKESEDIHIPGIDVGGGGGTGCGSHAPSVERVTNQARSKQCLIGPAITKLSAGDMGAG